MKPKAVTAADRSAVRRSMFQLSGGDGSSVIETPRPRAGFARRRARSFRGPVAPGGDDALTLARRALKGTSFESLEKFFVGTTAVAYTKKDPVALAKTLTTFVKTAPTLTIKAAVVQGVVAVAAAPL